MAAACDKAFPQRAKTDLRGMVSLDHVQGLATVIARASDDRYAFYRGTNQLGAVREAGKRWVGIMRGW